MNNNLKCRGCRYNTPKTQKGLGRICNGETMRRYRRCPEQAIDEYLDQSGAPRFSMKDCVNFHKVKP